MNKFSLCCALCSVILLTACGTNQQNKKNITQTPIKTNILGIELGEKITPGLIEVDLTRATEKEFHISNEQKFDVATLYTAHPSYSSFFNFGNKNWHYAVVKVDQNSLVYKVELHATFESIEQAKKDYESIIEIYEGKYGQGNADGEQHTFWTDGKTHVGVQYVESSNMRGEDRSYCVLYYKNTVLGEAVNKASQPDI